MQHKIVTFIALGVLVAGGVWYGLSREGDSTSLLAAQATTPGEAGDPALVETLLQLRAVSLSGTVLSDPAFLTLQDFGTQIVPEPIGRPNPFAPLTQSARPTSTPRGAQLFEAR